MYQLEQTGKFKKDIKLAKKRGLDMRLLDEVVTRLVESGTLPEKNKPHKLTGNYRGILGVSYSTRLAVNLGTARYRKAHYPNKNRHTQRLVLSLGIG